MKKHPLLIRLLLAVVFLAAAMSVANAQRLVVSPGTYLKNNGVTITLYNTDVQNNGTITSSNGSFMFSGSNNSFITGTGTTSMHAIMISKQNGAKLLLQKNVSATGTVAFSGGIFDLGNHQLELIYPGGLLQNESATSRITTAGTGEVFITQVLNAPSAVNPGNLGAVITSSQNLGSTVTRRGHKVQVNNTNDQSIARYFNITPANNTGLNATLRFSYLDAELNNNPEAGLAMWQKATSWSSIGASASDINGNYVQKNSIAAFTMFTLGKGTSGALPLQLTMFNVSCENAGSLVQWSTANEVNTKQFVIERSADGISWQLAATVPAQGNSVQHSYEKLIPAGAGNYFRLKMEDIDSKITYSPVRVRNCSTVENVVVGPNPTKGKLVITTVLAKPDAVNIVITDMNGRTVFSKAYHMQRGSNTQSLDISGLPGGTYIINVNGNDLKHRQLIVKA